MSLLICFVIARFLKCSMIYTTVTGHDIQPCFSFIFNLTLRITSPFLSLGNLTVLAHSVPDSLLDGNSSQNQTFPFELFHSPQSDEDCGIFDPVIGNWDLAKCDSFRGAVCQFKKGTNNNNNNNNNCIICCLHCVSIVKTD